MTLSTVLPVLFLLQQCLALSVCQSIVDNVREDDVCHAKSDGCTSESQLDLPPSWVVYLHSYESAKLKASKSCKGTVVIENIPLHCEYANAIREDLKIFNKISSSDLDQSRDTDKHAVTYKLIDGAIYRTRDCLFPSRCEGIEYFLKRISANISNLEFVINTHDWPFINRHFYPKPVPLLSFSKTSDHQDIYFPAWTFWAGGPAIKKYPTGLGRWDQMRDKLVASSNAWTWDGKLDQAFFRGSRTSSERDNLVMLARKNPDLVDASYTKNQAWKSNSDTLGMDPADEVSLEDHCKYRYLFNYRGVAASFRLKHLFLCKSLVFHVGDEWKEFFYGALKPWFHYVPVQNHSSEDEIEDLIRFVQSNPDLAKTIAANGFNFIQNHLTMVDVENYWKVLMISYSKLLDFDVKVPNDKFVKIK